MTVSTSGERGVNVHLTHVIHDQGDAPPFAVVEGVIEECGFARAEQAGEGSDWEPGHNDWTPMADYRHRCKSLAIRVRNLLPRREAESPIAVSSRGACNDRYEFAASYGFTTRLMPSAMACL